MVELAATIFADGPSSDPNQPMKPLIRDWGTWIEGVIAAFFGSGGKIYQTKAALTADLAPAANSSAWVMEDQVAANNGVYRKVGGTGTGSWVRAGDLPFSFIIASDVGAGTPNAIQATTSIPVSGSALIWMSVFETNTASPVTISFNGGSTLAVKTNSGNDPVPGGLPGGTIIMGIAFGSTFRLISDQASAAIVAAAEAAQVAAEAAAAGVNFRNVADRPALKALNTSITTLAFLGEAGRAGEFKWTLGDYSAQVTADTSEAIYIKANATSATVGAWIRQGGWQVGGIDIAWAGTPQAAVSLAGALGVKTVKGSGSYTLASTLSIPAGVRLFGASRALTLIQANGANLLEVISIGVGGSMSQTIIDGNRANNASDPNRVVVRIGNSNDCVIEDCVIKGAVNTAVSISNGLRAVVRRNEIHDFRDFGVFAFGVPFAEAKHIFEDNYFHDMGWGPFHVEACDYTVVKKNICDGSLIGGRAARLVVDTSGSTVTWKSGPTFATAKVGQWFVVNGGLEFRVTAVNSPTSLTVDTSLTALPTLTNAQASVGTGDLCGITASSFFQVVGNIFRNTATFGAGTSLNVSGAQCGNGIFADNEFINIGKNALNLSSFGGSGLVDNNSVRGNKIFNAGYAGGIGASDRIAILLTSAQVQGTNITDNTVLSFAGEGRTTHWLGFDGAQPFGSVSISGNRAVGLENPGVLNDISASGITLGAGWGTSATVSGVISYGDRVQFNITSAGSSIAANPSITVQKIVCSGAETPLPSPKMVTTSVAPTGLNAFYGEQVSTRGQWRATMSGTPTSGVIYTVSMTL